MLLPSSPQHRLLRTLPPFDPTAPTATSYPTVQQAITSPLRTLLKIIAHISKKETTAVDAEIKKRRQRLGGPALTAVETTPGPGRDAPAESAAGTVAAGSRRPRRRQ
ncbi:hypothetical protein AAT19DRAFT_10399 [Rhodotorula toruloides]|uniref:Uncharacterized protein n=1 Tax=Rhodotorula toruloides TaxID=5286 RepID=A0A2T0A0N1_RHOTO|nr:hypothetical protein AAT19DRAFT_10399 [Rhodotorula toruloides]